MTNEMSRTKSKIKSVMTLLEDWGVTKDLTVNELKTLEFELKDIAGMAIMEANNKIQNILPDFYKETTT